MTRQQILVLAGMAMALLVTVLLFQIPASRSHPGDALPLACVCLLAPALSIAGGVAFIANRRFFDRDAIDGAASSPAIDLAQRYLTNTIEQSVLAAMSWLAFGMVSPLRAVAMLPVLAFTFLAARLLFALGYALAPWARAFGFALTFYPTVGVLIWTVAALM